MSAIRVIRIIRIIEKKVELAIRLLHNYATTVIRLIRATILLLVIKLIITSGWL